MAGAREQDWFLWPLVHSLGREATHVRGVPDTVVAAAKRAVALRFSNLAGSSLDVAARQRVSPCGLEVH